jgi:D-sedoheptulose 7-phosphate isomerase
MSDREFIEKYLSQLNQAVDRICVEDIVKAVEVLFTAWKNKKKIFIMGNGGSASTATHFAADLNKTANVEGKERFKAMALVDNIPLCSALVNDDGFENLFVEQLKNFFEPGDVVIGISVHGGSGSDKAGLWSQNLLKAMQCAKQRGGLTLGLSGFDGGAMKKLADVSVVVPVDSTPFVESLHVTLEHLIVNCLRERIQSL